MKEEQVYFTATSALKLVQDSFSSTDSCYLDMPTAGTSVSSAFTYGKFSSTSDIGKWAYKWTTTIYQDYVAGTIGSYSESSSSEDFTIHADNSLMSGSDVTVRLTMSKDYTISASIVNADENYNYDLQVEIPLSSSQSKVNVDSSGKPTYSYVVSWGAAVSGYPTTKGAPYYQPQAAGIASANSLTSASDQNTKSLQQLYKSANDSAYPNITEEEAALNSISAGHASDYVWKPIIATDGTVILAACKASGQGVGDATGTIMIYVDGRYYSWKKLVFFVYYDDVTTIDSSGFDKDQITNLFLWGLLWKWEEVQWKN